MNEPQNPDDATRRPTSSFRRLLGCLVVVPLVAIGLGAQWTLEAPLETTTRSYAISAENRESSDAASAGAAIAFDRAVRTFAIELTGAGRQRAVVFAIDETGNKRLAWTAPEQAGDEREELRRSPWLRSEVPIVELRLSVRNTSPDALPPVRVLTPVLSWPHWTLAPIPWLLWFALSVVMRRGSGERAANPGPGSRVAAHVLVAWERADPWLAAAITYAILFRFVAPGLAGALALAALAVALLALRRWPTTGVVVVASLAVAALGVPRLLSAFAIAQVSEHFELTIDHRPKPNGRNINSDGLRHAGEADAILDETFVVAFLGDSFTFGTRLRDHATYPMAFERLLNLRACNVKVQSINMGWPSASPLLGLRLLRRIGRSYKPDLVVYNLDMTDFHDDLRYERALRSADEFEVDTRRVVRQIVDRIAPWLRAEEGLGPDLRRLLRSGPPRDIDLEPLPADRFFVTSAPLDETRASIEAGVGVNLAALSAFARNSLAVPFVTVLLPRAYQYSDRETPRNWERNDYIANGPFVREPFRYFSEHRDELAYPIVDLLPAFEASTTFPLYLEDDPHWNRAGARLAAETLIDALDRAGMLPCD